MAKTKEQLADLRQKRPKHAENSDLHQFQYNHPRRAEDHAVDAVCSRCGLEQIDVTPTAKKQSARWRWPESPEVLAAKPACLVTRPKTAD